MISCVRFFWNNVLKLCTIYLAYLLKLSSEYRMLHTLINRILILRLPQTNRYNSHKSTWTAICFNRKYFGSYIGRFLGEKWYGIRDSIIIQYTNKFCCITKNQILATQIWSQCCCILNIRTILSHICVENNPKYSY